MATGARIDSQHDAWIVHFDDPVVTQLRVDHRFTLVLEGALLAIGEPFMLQTPDGSWWVPPSDASHDVAPALPLLHQELTVLRVARSGELTLEFDSGAIISVPSNEHYENWDLSWSDGELWVGAPGGHVSWDAPGGGQVRHLKPLEEGRP
jgi:hypothetical protein